MIDRGIATFTLDSGKCPKWLFDRMVLLGREMMEVIIEEHGSDEFIKRIGDPVWFQSLGTVLAFDWNASGLTTILTAALKEAIKGMEGRLGIFICGGKGKTSRKTPDEIKVWADRLSFPDKRAENLVYNSRMAAKVDSALVQDGFQIYHHAFFFSTNGAWAVVQQGMNTANATARRYHWYSEKITDLVCEPHSGIASQVKVPALNLTAKDSTKNRELSTELVHGGFNALMKDIELLRRHYSEYSKTVSFKHRGEKTTLLQLPDLEFNHHPAENEDFSKSKYLEKILFKLCDEQPLTYEELLSKEGVGPKTIRALSLVSEVIYGADASYEDPARYSFAHGGKDATPYPVDRPTYDNTIEFFSKVVKKTKFPRSDRARMLDNLLQ